MDKNFNWKQYFYITVLIVVILALINYKISLGWLLGNICYFINDKIVSLKFKNLKDTSIVGNIVIYMLIQMILVLGTSYMSWYVGKLAAFIAYVVGIICPNVYYMIISVFKNKNVS